MAARGNRDALVIATKVGSDGGLSAPNIAHARRGVAGAAADRPHRSLLRPQGRRVGAGRGDRPRVRRAGPRRQGPPRRRLEHLGRAADRVAGARRRARAWRRTSGCSRTTTSSSATRYEREYAPIVAEYGLSVAPYYALAERFSDRQVPAGFRRRRQPARRHGVEVPRRPRPDRAGRAGRGRRRARRPGRGDRRRLARGQARGRGPDRERPQHPTTPRRSCRRVGLVLGADELSLLDEASA